MARPEGVDPLNPDRYRDPAAESRGVIAEIYQDLPPHLQEALANDNRRATFKKHVCFMSFHPFLCPCLIDFVVPQAAWSGACEYSTCDAWKCGTNTWPRYEVL
jgi:hypothetical protein